MILLNSFCPIYIPVIYLSKNEMMHLQQPYNQRALLFQEHLSFPYQPASK